jgi:hypothetical protein
VADDGIAAVRATIASGLTAGKAEPHPDLKEKQRGATSQATILLDIAQGADLFHTLDGTGFADLEVRGHRETWPIRSKTFRRWLSRSYYERTGGAPNSEARQTALNIIEAQAAFDGREQSVSVRVAGFSGMIYLDLVDEEWRAVEISADGWRVIKDPPVRFRRSAGMRPLPRPMCGGSVNSLRSFLNVQSDADFTLIVAWVLAALRDCGPYPVIVVAGEQGSAKSTVSGIIRRLVDPNTAPLRALPREERDLFIAATNAHALAFDNVSGMPPWISDALCRLSTGGGFATRELHTDQDEVLFNAERPVILNGIEDIATRADLADRAVMLTLSPIADEKRRTEKEIWDEFHAAHPAILGALLDGVVRGLSTLPNTTLKRKPRMADFALWVTACEPALNMPCTFEAAYSDNRTQATETVIEANPVAEAVRTLMNYRTEWAGTATQLLEELSDIAGDTIKRSKHWPGAAHVLSGRLRRAATFLRKVGIEIDLGTRQGHASNKIIRITTADRELPF